MNRDFIRARFRHYRQQIENLNSQIYDLNQTLESQYSYAEEAESRRIRQARACENERIERERQAEILTADIRPGDYFYTSWGYDQTNIDYLVVVSVTAKTAVCKMVSPIHVGESGQADVLMPGTSYGDTFRMRISGKDSLTGSYPYCEGSKRLIVLFNLQNNSSHYEVIKNGVVDFETSIFERAVEHYNELD